MAKNLKYVKQSDDEVADETERRLREMKELLWEIRDLLKAAGGLE
jgi:hypothetical protein